MWQQTTNLAFWVVVLETALWMLPIYKKPSRTKQWCLVSNKTKEQWDKSKLVKVTQMLFASCNT